jgi:hypothetical protein
MIDNLFTDKELELLLELLEAESKRLAVGVRHTDAREMRTELRERERTVDRIIERLHAVHTGGYKPL